MTRVKIENLGPIEKIDIELGDLTILVGPQASGKSLFLQTYKAMKDAFAIREEFRKYGYEWDKDSAVSDFCSSYYGGGHQTLFRENTTFSLNEKTLSSIDISRPRKPRNQSIFRESVFLIPAQRVQVLSDGWPKAFMTFPASDPYCIKHFSESVRILMENELSSKKFIFPAPQKLKAGLRNTLNNSIFLGGKLSIDRQGARKRIVLEQNAGKAESTSLAFGAWSAGQREFTPLLFGLLWLMPSSKVSKLSHVQTVIIEEPEMGLHPQAIVCFGLLLFELMRRGYKVIVSTHTPILLDLVWAMQELKNTPHTRTRENAYKKIFGLHSMPQDIREILTATETKKYKTYFFNRNETGKVTTQDISSLDPWDEDKAISGWGGLSGYSGNIAEAVGEASI